MIWVIWWINFRARRRAEALPSYRLEIEFRAVGIVALTGRLPKRRKRPRLDVSISSNLGCID
jgi:hypothetical protein